MADHATKQALDAAKDLIIAGATLAGSDVFTGRVTPFTEAELPAIRLRVEDESLSPLAMGNPRPTQRLLSMDIEMTVQKLDNYDVDAFNLLKQVEHILDANTTLGGKARQALATGVSWEHDIEANQTIARVTLRCDVIVAVMSNAVDVPI